METRAPYALIGMFVLTVIAAVFGFVYWLHNTGSLTERAIYRIRFDNTVSGLLTGAAVLFNGIRVGEVTALELDPNNPNVVTGTVALAASTPVRADTKVSLDFQGLTGVPVVIMQGGSQPLTRDATRPEPPFADSRTSRRSEHDDRRTQRGSTTGYHLGRQRRPAPHNYR